MSNEHNNAVPYLADQWWVSELDTITGTKAELTQDQYRAVEIARQLIKSKLATAPAVSNSKVMAQMDEVMNRMLRHDASPDDVSAISLIDRLAASPAVPSQPVLTGCNCRWDGGTQVQWCELHLAHKDAIHEWAERAKTAEAKLAQLSTAQEPVTLTDEPVAYIETITGRLCAPQDEHCLKFPMCYAPLYTRPAASPQSQTDEVFEALELDPESFRTDGGAVNTGKLKAAILHPYNYLPPDHWLQARFSKPGGRPNAQSNLLGEGRTVVFGPGRESGEVFEPVTLTDEEIFKCIQVACLDGSCPDFETFTKQELEDPVLTDFARAIIAALREKEKTK